MHLPSIRSKLVALTTVAACTAAAAPTRADRTFFHDLRILDGDREGAAYGVSSDGSVVVGMSFNSRTGRTSAVRWSNLGLAERIDASNFDSMATAISGDGQTIVGLRRSQAYRWRSAGNIPLPGETNMSAVSFDGSVIVGDTIYPPGSLAYPVACGWSEEGGFRILLEPSIDFQSRAAGVSGDGSVIVGSTEAINLFQERAFISSVEGGFAQLPMPVGCIAARANAVSLDGHTIVGRVDCVTGQEPVVWSPSAVTVLTGHFEYSEALAVSGDGTVVVGSMRVATTGGEDEAFVWTQQRGVRRIRDVLSLDYGINLPTNWKLRRATAISADGHTIVGEGTEPCGGQAPWIVHFGVQPACGGDYNKDGRATVQDVFDFLTDWFSGRCSVIGLASLHNFVNAYLTPCE